MVSGVPQDDILAFKWMRAAAEKNHTNAQFNLAKMYLAARGVASDIGQAKVWLQKAASHGHDEAVKLLAEISSRAANEQAAPSTAPSLAPAGRRDPVKIETRRDLPNAGRVQSVDILEAAWRGQSDAVRKLISSGASISSRDDDGNTALALAASAGKTDAVDVLLSAGADVNTENRQGERPVMLAAVRGHADIVDRLLRRGADVNATTKSCAFWSIAEPTCERLRIRGKPHSWWLRSPAPKTC
jgi:uncharacterized protein